MQGAESHEGGQPLGGSNYETMFTAVTYLPPFLLPSTFMQGGEPHGGGRPLGGVRGGVGWQGAGPGQPGGGALPQGIFCLYVDLYTYL